jgi:hypothetical protein
MIRVDSLAHLASSMYNIILWVEAVDNYREVFIDSPAEVVGVSVGVMHDQNY